MQLPEHVVSQRFRITPITAFKMIYSNFDCIWKETYFKWVTQKIGTKDETDYREAGSIRKSIRKMD